MPILTNALINTSRSTFTSGTGVTSTAMSILTGIATHIRPVTSSSYKALPVAALESDYAMTLDTGTDVREGDIVSSITLSDGVTPWPSVGVGTNNNETFRVTYVNESTPGPLQHRTVYVARIRGGGPTY